MPPDIYEPYRVTIWLFRLQFAVGLVVVPIAGSSLQGLYRAVAEGFLLAGAIGLEIYFQLYFSARKTAYLEGVTVTAQVRRKFSQPARSVYSLRLAYEIDGKPYEIAGPVSADTFKRCPETGEFKIKVHPQKPACWVPADPEGAVL